MGESHWKGGWWARAEVTQGNDGIFGGKVVKAQRVGWWPWAGAGQAGSMTGVWPDRRIERQAGLGTCSVSCTAPWCSYFLSQNQ